MPLSSKPVSGLRLRWSRLLQRSVLVACSAATIGTHVSAGENEAAPTLPPLMQSSKLRFEARLAAEQGDFVKAATSLEQAALIVGDRETAARVSADREQLNANGGSMADFSSLMTLIMEQTSPPAEWIMQGDETGSMTPYMQGVFVGAPAMAGALLMTLDNSRLTTAFELARTANSNRDVHETADLRLVSLPRLERHIAALQAAGEPVPADVTVLAGLTEVEFLFVFPDTGDVVIGGPAGDWTADASGRTVNVNSNRPTLQLDDLVTLSRTFSGGGRGFFMCTIDPKVDQVRAVKEFAANTQLTAGNVRQVTEKLEQTLGLQNVTVMGVPTDSRVASVIVDADYQMKLIGIGRREGAEGMKSYFELAGRSERNGATMDALRWWMTVGYDAIHVSPDRRAFEFTGRSIRCQSENQLVDSDGTRKATGKADGANAEFARLFTENLPELAEKDAVFADLQNIFDLALATAIVNSLDLQRQAGWKPEVFAAGSQFETQTVDVPKELMTA
ncbi:MAG: DUF1598 domain-containing protein, partial [Planctomycetia bacterium]